MKSSLYLNLNFIHKSIKEVALIASINDQYHCISNWRLRWAKTHFWRDTKVYFTW